MRFVLSLVPKCEGPGAPDWRATSTGGPRIDLGIDLGLCFPTLSAEKRGKDGARGVCGDPRKNGSGFEVVVEVGQEQGTGGLPSQPLLGEDA